MSTSGRPFWPGVSRFSFRAPAGLRLVSLAIPLSCTNTEQCSTFSPVDFSCNCGLNQRTLQPGNVIECGGMKRIILALAILATSAWAQELKVGDMAPDFTLKASDGQTYTLSKLRGTTVVLAWFPKAFTSG